MSLSVDTAVAKTAPESSAPAMSHRQVLEALSGLLLGMFVSILAGTVVSTSLPRIIADLHGDQAAFTWVVTATLLATTVSTPIWGKFAELFSRKLLIQLSLVVFVLGSSLLAAALGLAGCGSNGDGASAIAIDSSNNAYVTGYTNSADFPATSKAWRPQLNGGASQDTFVAKLSLVP